MKALIDKLASGNSVYETPDAEISENRIAVELEPGETSYGEISIQGKNGMRVKGVVFSTDSHLTFENNQFQGINNKVKYLVTTKNLGEGQIVSGTISVVTTAGDYAIPFGITVKKRKITSTIGDIESLEDFVGLVKQSYDEALILFLSKEFREFFLKNDAHSSNLYTQVMKNLNRNIALEEFLVGMNLKERVSLSIPANIREYTDMTENYGDAINISRSTWGYVDIDVSVEGDFLYNCKQNISGGDFNGKICEYQYFINASRLHGGSNHGRITLRTSEETFIYDIVIVNQKESIETYINKKKNSISMMKNYLNFRTGVIDGKQWMEEMAQMAEERILQNKNDVIGLLSKAQIAIIKGKETEANNYLNKVSGILSVKEATSVEEYCYYLYLKTLYKNNPNFTEDIKAEIKKYFESGHDTWQLLWLLFYMDERYDENPSLKYTMIKRMFNNGCFSPAMYFEAANVIIKQPEILRVLNRFEVQVLNFAAKYHMVNDELAKQAADVIGKEKVFNESYFNILSRIYEDTKNKEVLCSICTMLINGSKTENEYFKWFKEGVKQDLKITSLYEYYIYAIDTDNYEPLEKSAYKYFSYGTDTIVYNKDYFFANVVKNICETNELFEKYRESMGKYATEELLRGNNNRHLRIVYGKILTDDFIIGSMEEKMPEVLHTYMISVRNDNIKAVNVSHKEVTGVQTLKVADGRAYIRLYTENPIIMFVDSKGRLLSESDYELTKMDVESDITKTGSNAMTLLCQVEEIMKNPQENSGKIMTLKKAMDLPQLTNEFRAILREFIVDYYYQGLDKGDMDIYILQFNMAELTKESRNKVMEILIERNLMEMVYPYVAKYGYQSIRNNLLEELCIELVSKEEYDGNAILVEMCGVTFRNGCRDEDVLKFLGKYYEAGSLELYQIFLALKSKEIDDNTLAERLIVQYIFEGSVEDKIYDIYMDYLKGSTATTVRKAFYTYVTYNYFIKKIQCPDIVWEVLEQEFFNGLVAPLIGKISFIEVMSKKATLTERQINICQKLIESLAKTGVNFEFYKKFNRWFKIPFTLVDKTIIDFRTNPKHRVDITYDIKTLEGRTAKVTEEMGGVYQGIFTKEIIMFYGEEIDYSITEYSDEYPQGKVVDNYSVRISETNAYNDESRFGLINGMMICKALGKDDAAREMMQSYELCKEAGKELFKLL